MTAIDGVLDRLDKDLDASLERLFTLLKIPSISTDSDYAEDCEKAADWLVADLSSIGFEARKMPTAGHPMVVAHYHDAPGKSTVLFYGHYDVQPVDPLGQ
jgi:acetylornithine deacetylase/succinyl-diaminopimelate desuccinylase-like protein